MHLRREVRDSNATLNPRRDSFSPMSVGHGVLADFVSRSTARRGNGKFNSTRKMALPDVLGSRKNDTLGKTSCVSAIERSCSDVERSEASDPAVMNIADRGRN